VGNEDKVTCTKNQCTSEDRNLARLLPATVFVKYLDSRRQLFEKRLEGENQEHFRKAVEEEVARIDAMGSRQRMYFPYPLVSYFFCRFCPSPRRQSLSAHNFPSPDHPLSHSLSLSISS